MSGSPAFALERTETHEVRCGERRRGGIHHGERCNTVIGYSPAALAFVGTISRAPEDAKTIIAFRCWRCKAWNLFHLLTQES